MRRRTPHQPSVSHDLMNYVDTVAPRLYVLRSLAVLGMLALGSVSAAADVDFNRDVRPILSDKCYFCHGPDEGQREAGLRLDVREEAIDLLESGDVVERICSEDSDTLMPPPDSKLKLTDEEKQTIRQWIDEGAPYDAHWAFTPLPELVSVPQPDEPQWCREAIDRFVLASLDERNIVPSRTAPPLRWLRRATLDLTGLPPTTKEIAEFERSLKQLGESDVDKAYESVVDRLLQSPAFGEHMAVSWLDAARYADSYGYQSDKLNTQWPYRDWVVRAINENLAYDKFLTWQLAGDLLPDSTPDQKLATAFNRIHRLNNEGGAVFEEWRIENVADRVHTFGTAMLGLTMECCRCHDHKYDPILMRDYYSLSAFFNSIDESGVYDRTEKVPCPSMLLPTPMQQADLESAAARIRDADVAYAEVLNDSRERFADWQSSGEIDLPIPDLRLALALDRDFDNSIKEIYHPSESDRSWAAMVKLGPVVDCLIPRLDPNLAADKVVSQEVGSEEGDHESVIAVVPRRALLLDGERGVTTHGIAPFDRWTPFSVVMTLRDTKRTNQRSILAHHTRGTDCGYNGWDLTIDGGYLESRMARVWPGNAIAVRARRAHCC